MVVLCWLLVHIFVDIFSKQLRWYSAHFSGSVFVAAWFLLALWSENRTHYAWSQKSFTSFLGRILFGWVCSMLCTPNRTYHDRFTVWVHKCQQVICMAIMSPIVCEDLCKFIRETFIFFESKSFLNTIIEMSL